MNTAIHQEDTIAALATPPGVSGLAVIRVSGADAIDCVAAVFRGGDLRQASSHTMHHGHVLNPQGHTIDEVLAAVFRAPRSYTGENSVEISCHGGATAYRAVLDRLYAAGVRHAEPGEFTRRAFLNGKMDLSQAEAVADLIHAQSEDAHQASVRQLEGRLSSFVEGIRSSLLHCLGMLELSLDFVEEDVEFLTAERLRSDIAQAEAKLRDALATFRSGRIIREGVKVVLLGKPNVGKSSLLNAVLGTQRAIVTDVPGTTRDYIEEQMMLHGRPFRFVDTAGLRETHDRVEQLGISASTEQLRDADIVCGIIDDPAESEGLEVLRSLAADIGARCIGVLNKCDLHTHPLVTDTDLVSISALHGTGLDVLLQRLADVAANIGMLPASYEVVVTNVRHAACIERGITALGRAASAAEAGRTEECIAVELREAADALGEIIGVVTTDDILNGIFSRFCIGK
ncbi:MAG: tRNA uridine-5-carboxymethylaminomethyl(34) synthesis GTPase MnmE [Bacteroidia bacterium]|nr:tRNA uridine-5-carboxymethylaminomethyl(34) synthesis GTPase MnmE [Bacteroidia bacterium]